MSKVLVIGCGAVASVAIQKIAQNHEVFKEMVIASRTKSKCEHFASKLNSKNIKVIAEEVDADNKDNVISLIQKYHPDIVVNVALPYQNIPIMEACIETKTHYLDTACAENKQVSNMELSGFIMKSLKKLV